MKKKDEVLDALTIGALALGVFALALLVAFSERPVKSTRPKKPTYAAYAN